MDPLGHDRGEAEALRDEHELVDVIAVYEGEMQSERDVLLEEVMLVGNAEDESYPNPATISPRPMNISLQSEEIRIMVMTWPLSPLKS